MNVLKKQGEALLYVVPAALLVTAFFVYSVVYTFVLSFKQWDGLKPSKWVGVGNYTIIFQDSTYITSLYNTLIWVVASLVIPVGLGLLLSVWLQGLKGQVIFKNVFYIPYAIALTVVGVIWAILYSKSGINLLLTEMGLEHWTVDWLNTPPYNTYAMVIAAVWQVTGTNMLLFLVGLSSLPKDPFEAASIDGAGKVRTFFHITLPLLKPMTIVVVGMTLVNSFKIFDVIWVMTMGGPYRSSETFAVTMYRESFVLFNFGQGAAIAILLTVASILVSWFYLKRTIGDGD